MLNIGHITPAQVWWMASSLLGGRNPNEDVLDGF